MVDFLRVPADVPGGFITRIDRLDDGRVMCCICCGWFTTEELAPVEDEPGRHWDMCKSCKKQEDDHEVRRNR